MGNVGHAMVWLFVLFCYIHWYVLPEEIPFIGIDIQKGIAKQ